MIRLQMLIDNSLFGDYAWTQSAIEYREKLRAQIAQLRGQA